MIEEESTTATFYPTGPTSTVKPELVLQIRLKKQRYESEFTARILGIKRHSIVTCAI